ncbi:sensor domain-containing diguanylate cyclase [Aliiglaciecola sp. CAU 1673]|uniref:sensor domain-containing diguanylate cyclase n=1 Tax=Aliiglaciecola sp. CAU 1673 TaxID=3032595 RepID=UPI0023DA236A|nr:sensor domain-containing diguanylate cyclase [Aliiglaciecola sp. CAU 1673]MDF2179659.1 sensor domain-containing diguanylate cyclase [Aliiglaciecola sp. CAU 1673]
MNIFESMQRNLVILFLLAVAAISAVTYFAINNVVSEQSRIQQRAMAPVFSLIRQELIRPLYMAQMLDALGPFKGYLDGSEPDPQALQTKLENIGNTLDMLVFVASERERIQLQSNRETIILDPEHVDWYFRYKDMPGDFFAVLGKRAQPHLYMDIKQYDKEGNFLGFIGVGKSLAEFMRTFERYKKQYGYDFVFVNSAGEIALSSDPKWEPRAERYQKITELAWYQYWDKSKRTEEERSEFISFNNEDFLITQVPIEAMQWQMFLLSPLEEQQQASRYFFISNLAVVLSLILVTTVALAYLLKHFSQHVNKRLYTDPLSGISNRLHMEKLLEDMRAQGNELCLIMADIDRFKDVNDTYGHNVGDDVIRIVSRLMQQGMRKQDFVGRWGGEEFVMLLPETDLELARQVAERIRLSIAERPIALGNLKLHVTLSFGVTHTTQNENTTELVDAADKALYQAKQAGRNRVVARELTETS